MPEQRTIALSVEVTDDLDIARVYEVMARAAAGLLMDGIESRLYTWRNEDDG